MLCFRGECEYKLPHYHNLPNFVPRVRVRFQDNLGSAVLKSHRVKLKQNIQKIN